MSSKVRSKIPDVRLEGKTVIVTGANSGIGKETAKELARKGARVILACRNRMRAESARDEIVKDSNNQNVVVKILDLASLESVKDFAEEINATEDRIDILVNNAGVATTDRRETADGFEMMFGTNHLGPFYLTNLLLDKLKVSAPSRIVTVSSVAYNFSAMDFRDLQYQKNFKSSLAYCRSKTANIMHGVHLAKLLEGTGVTVYTLHPGLVRTDLIREYGAESFLMRVLYGYGCMFGEKTKSVAEGAETTLYCCLEPSIATHSGRYYTNCKETHARRFATHAQAAEKLWNISVELTRSAMTARL